MKYNTLTLIYLVQWFNDKLPITVRMEEENVLTPRGKRKMDLAEKCINFLLFAMVAVHVLICPFTKVEESNGVSQ